MTSEAEANAHAPELPWIVEGQALPPVSQAWGASSPAPGLLAASNDVTAPRLMQAYAEGVFPWFSVGQPVLWWSPDPRMVLKTRDFRFHRSLQQSLKRCSLTPRFEMCFDRDFSQVIQRCASSPRPGQKGTWIVPHMVTAYEELHSMGLAHSCELRIGGELVAGLYFVALGRAVFGESMFTTVSDGSKMALACLVSVCLQHGVQAIDCQQNTRHLGSLGAREIPRSDFVRGVHEGREQGPIDWAHQSLNWPALASLAAPTK
jgi:leucyl/phenylalanyl-tRNA--protein transferase